RTPEDIAARAYRRFKRGWSVTMPGFMNKIGAVMLRFVPDFMLIPAMGWLFRPRNDEGQVLWPGGALEREVKEMPKPCTSQCQLEPTESASLLSTGTSGGDRPSTLFWVAAVCLSAPAAILFHLAPEIPFGIPFDEPLKVSFVLSGTQNFEHPILML